MVICYKISNIFIVFIMVSNSLVYSVFNADVSVFILIKKRYVPNSIIPYVMSAAVFLARFVV